MTYRCGWTPGTPARPKAGDCPAWFVPQEPGSPGDGKTWAILLHGRGATRAEPLHGLAGAVRAGLPALDITYRNDEGAPRDASGFYRYGETEWADLAVGADGYAREHGARDVVLFGYSMGGAIVASYLRARRAARSPCAGWCSTPRCSTSARTVDFGASHRSLPLVGLPIPGALVGTAKAIAGARFDIDWDAIDYLDDAWLDVPALVIHGATDRTVPPATSKAFAANHPERVKLVLVPDGTHVGSWKADPARTTAPSTSSWPPCADGPTVSSDRGAESEPAGALEGAEEQQADEGHRHEGDRVTEAGAEFGHVLEVHPVQPGDEGRDGDHRRPRGDPAHVVVLTDAHLREVRVQHVGELGVVAVDQVDDARDVVGDVAEVRA